MTNHAYHTRDCFHTTSISLPTLWNRHPRSTEAARKFPQAAVHLWSELRHVGQSKVPSWEEHGLELGAIAYECCQLSATFDSFAIPEHSKVYAIDETGSIAAPYTMSAPSPIKTSGSTSEVIR